MWYWLAAQGFQVFVPGFRGSQQFCLATPPTDEVDFHDIMSGVEQLIADGHCNETCIGIHGFSYGASVAAFAIGNTDRFRAAVLVGGLYDAHLAYGLSSETGGNMGYELEYGGTPWEKPEIYKRLSATTYTKNVNAAVLLLNGENDHKEHPEYYCTWLRRMGKTVEYVLYDKGGHQLDQEAHTRDRWQRTLAWFRRFLLDPSV